VEVALVVQVNVKLDERLVREVEKLVEAGHVKTKKEAFERALKLLIRSHKAAELEERIDRLREGTEAMPSVTEAVIESHEEEEH
jgi:Arc/MetJ family transcription regulator